MTHRFLLRRSALPLSFSLGIQSSLVPLPLLQYHLSLKAQICSPDRVYSEGVFSLREFYDPRRLDSLVCPDGRQPPFATLNCSSPPQAPHVNTIFSKRILYLLHFHNNVYTTASFLGDSCELLYSSKSKAP
ncbi:hypothetical protein BDN72DRAFT_299916 [Pluteus cervinus]|uniref:Uncharacterized protein n=1 Tax=Pluteus cervinus TaxID=181527 RepID=A0ACD3AE32_9AGAR|nr:hypothetical protein BDN72DRAFT_299916 [Pluteus cervinus]